MYKPLNTFLREKDVYLSFAKTFPLTFLHTMQYLLNCHKQRSRKRCRISTHTRADTYTHIERGRDWEKQRGKDKEKGKERPSVNSFLSGRWGISEPPTSPLLKPVIMSQPISSSHLWSCYEPIFSLLYVPENPPSYIPRRTFISQRHLPVLYRMVATVGSMQTPFDTFTFTCLLRWLTFQ